MVDKLDVFLAAQAGWPWQWGVNDCCAILAAWCVANGRADPASAWRGRYGPGWRDEIGHPDLLSLISALADEGGFLPATAPVRGVVGVLGSRRRADKQWGALFDGVHWQMRTPEGFVGVTAHPLAMWTV